MLIEGNVSIAEAAAELLRLKRARLTTKTKEAATAEAAAHEQLVAMMFAVESVRLQVATTTGEVFCVALELPPPVVKVRFVGMVPEPVEPPPPEPEIAVEIEVKPEPKPRPPPRPAPRADPFLLGARRDLGFCYGSRDYEARVQELAEARRKKAAEKLLKRRQSVQTTVDAPASVGDSG